MATRRKPPAAAWKPGQSGNPKGRPAGTGEVAKLRAAIADRVPELLAAMMARALDGDVGAARLLLDMLADPHAEPQMIKLDYELKCRASTGDDNSDENVWSL